MSTQPVIEEQPIPEVKKARYEWQPTDEEGRPLGGKQVVEYEEGNHADFAAKMTETNVNLQRELRKIKRDQTLGDAPIHADEIKELETLAPASEPIKLTAAERLQLTRELNDPEKCDEAADKLFRSTPSYAQLNRNAEAVRAREEGNAFAVAHPDFHRCKENAEALVRWCVKRNLALTSKNFAVAYDKLKGAGLLLEAPIAAEEPRANTQPEPENESRITPEEQVPAKRPVKTSSGLTRNMGSSAPRNAQTRKGLTWAEVDRWSSSEYQAKFRDPEIRKQIDALPPR